MSDQGRMTAEQIALLRRGESLIRVSVWGGAPDYASIVGDLMQEVQRLAAENAALQGAMRKVMVHSQDARAMFERLHVVFDRWPMSPSGAPWTPERVAELDDEVRWQGVAFTLYTLLAEAESEATRAVEEPQP